MKKQTIRKNMLAIRNAIPEQQRKNNSVLMWQHLTKTEIYQNTDIIFTYVSIHKEAETTSFFTQVWEDGKKIAVPITEKNRKMDFVFLNTFEELTQKKWGIPEPEKSKSTLALPTEKSLFLVPALAIDDKGGRIGYGGGYYDTYFAKIKNGFKIGFVFSIQRIENLEMEDTDILLDGVITEKGVYFFKN